MNNVIAFSELSKALINSTIASVFSLKLMEE